MPKLSKKKGESTTGARASAANNHQSRPGVASIVSGSNVSSASSGPSKPAKLAKSIRAVQPLKPRATILAATATVTARAIDSKNKGKSKKDKDPDAPKRPMTGFLHYTQAQRASLRAQNLGVSMSEISKILGAQWRAMSVDEKKPYNDLYTKAKTKYEIEKAVYEAGKAVYDGMRRGQGVGSSTASTSASKKQELEEVEEMEEELDQMDESEGTE
ncbi:High mobility group [Dissophora globulifera]|uniref:High mobility group n=1 Tax=Dissophora globulifera TaxID=979702 RepID=A0A9P6USD6_9FUNG|nr:High mobility group [Dissophora globulifera]